MTRRLIIGGVATAAAAAFALVPTDSLRVTRPSKPLFLYLEPVIAALPLLAQAGDAGSEARWDELAGLLSTLNGPLALPANLQAAAAHADVDALCPAGREYGAAVNNEIEGFAHAVFLSGCEC